DPYLGARPGAGEPGAEGFAGDLAQTLLADRRRPTLLFRRPGKLGPLPLGSGRRGGRARRRWRRPRGRETLLQERELPAIFVFPLVAFIARDKAKLVVEGARGRLDRRFAECVQIHLRSLRLVAPARGRYYRDRRAKEKVAI